MPGLQLVQRHEVHLLLFLVFPVKDQFDLQPDLCLLPIGSRFTMDPREAALAVELLGASRVVPIHHSTFPPLTGTPEQFAEEVAARGLSPEITVMEPGDSISV